jgi:predicted RNA-binding Zn-ribbon protein involved in translation (DUF1610 family)
MPTNMNNILGEMGFDSSLHNMDSQLTIQEYRERLQVLLQPILDQRFPGNAHKRKILPHHDRITFACPYCGDSAQSDWAKRGNFILAGKFKNHFKCHNCGEFKRIDRFFKDYKTELKLDAINYMMDNLGDFTTFESAKYDMSFLLDMDNLEKYAIDRQELLRCFGLVEVKDSPVWSWLTNRMQYNTDKFLYSPEKNYLLILNLTPGGKILGAQKRKFKGTNRFETYKFSKLYEAMEKPVETDEAQTNYLDALSMIFNICLINFSKPILLLEGPMDAFLLPNAIANTGANKTMPIDIPVEYFYDSDETGVRKSIEYINKGNSVFLWQKFLRDINAPYRKKWDYNDVVIWTKQNNTRIPNVLNYFSTDPLDIIDI